MNKSERAVLTSAEHAKTKAVVDAFGRDMKTSPSSVVATGTKQNEKQKMNGFQNDAEAVHATHGRSSCARDANAQLAATTGVARFEIRNSPSSTQETYEHLGDHATMNAHHHQTRAELASTVSMPENMCRAVSSSELGVNEIQNELQNQQRINMSSMINIIPSEICAPTFR